MDRARIFHGRAVCAAVCLALCLGFSPILSIAASQSSAPAQDRASAVSGYAMTADAGATDAGVATWSGVNPGQHIRAVFTAAGVRLSRDEASSPWTVTLAVDGYGYGDALTPAGRGALSVEGNRIDYRWNDLNSRFVNRAEGIEQSFVLPALPARDDSKEPVTLSFGITLGGDVVTVPSKSGLRTRFTTQDGHIVLALTDLRATDAAGRVLPAKMDYALPQANPGKLTVQIEAPDAEFPVNLSLLITTTAPNDAPLGELRLLSADDSGIDDGTGGEVSPTFVPPPNDTCGGAEIIPPAGPFPYLTAITADITDATTAGDPSPLTGCPIGTPSPSRGIWYRFTPTASGTYTIVNCADAPTGSTVDDTILDVYTSSTGSCGGVMTAIACDDDACTTENLQSSVTVALTGGTNYFIVVHKWDNVAPTAGNTAIQLRVNFAAPPANDTCGGVLPLTLNIPRAGTTIAAANDFTLPAASPCFAQPSPPAPVGQTASTAVGRDVVYSFTAPAGGSYSFRVTGYTGGGNPVLYVTSNCAPGAYGTPPCLGAANRRSTSPFAEEVMCMGMAGGQVVFVTVDENALTGGGNFTVEVNNCTRETEPNDTPPTANPLPGTCGLETSVNPANNVDFFAVSPGVPPNARIFMMSDGVAANTADIQFRTTTNADTYEFDDDDGDASYGGTNSVIAGTRMTPGGPTFLRVNPFNAATTSEPHRLYSVVQPPSTAAVPETEPNGGSDPPNSAASNYFQGVTNTTDQDDFGFNAAAGDLIFVAVDTDPDMDGSATDVTVGLFDPSLTLVAQVNGSAAVSSTRTPVLGSLVATTPVAPGEGLVYRARVAGTYIAAVLGVAAGPGNYLMSISKNCIPGGGGIVTTDTFPSNAKIVLQLFPPFFPSNDPEIIRLRQVGPDAQVTRTPQVGNTIQTELVQLSLTGVCPAIGTVNVNESPSRPSIGAINVTGPGNPVSGDSFFDVFAEVHVGGVTLFNDTPFHVQTHIEELPPHNRQYENPFFQPVLLYDTADPPPGGAPRGRILYEVHHADPEFPPPDEDCFDTTFNGFIQLFPPLPNYSNQISATGETHVRRGPPSVFPPGPQVVQTEMVELSLTGTDPFLGPFHVTRNTLPGWPLSLGRVTGQPTRAFPADSFFDVFFELDAPGSIGPLVTGQSPILGDPNGGVEMEANASLSNQLGTLPPGSGQHYRQPPGQQTRLYRPSDLSTPVGFISQIDHGIDKPVSWEPPPPPDKDCFQSRITARLQIFPPFVPGGCTETLTMNGPFKVWRGSPFDPGDGRDIIRTLMACYQFTAVSGSCALGPVLAHPSPTDPSFGQVQSLAPEENFPADSFFDIFTQLETGIGPLHTSSPTHMDTTINSLPPAAGEIYFGPGSSVPLYNSSNVQVGTLEVISHEIISAIVCPCICEPRFLIRPNKTTLDFGIALGGAGVQYDLVRGKTQNGSINWLSSFTTSVCLQADGPDSISDASSPVPNQLFWYASRDAAFLQAYGTYNACPITTQVGNRDLEIPPAVCP